jgi:hypothetical protein
LNKSVDFDLQKIETREAEIYQELIKGLKKWFQHIPKIQIVHY